MCPFVPAPPFPDFQDIEGREQGNRILRYLEEELEELCHHSVSTHSGKFIYRALAHETTRFLGDPRFVEYSWELDYEDVYSFLIAAVCKFQVVVSQCYAHFPSIDQLRKILLDRLQQRRYGGPSMHHQSDLGSWEGGVPDLSVLPSDEEVEANYNAYVPKYSWLARQGGP